MIKKIIVSPILATDRLIWIPSRSGIPSFSDFYDMVHVTKPKISASFQAIYHIWKVRNDQRFNNKTPSLVHFFASCKAKIQLNCALCSGYVKCSDGPILNLLGVHLQLQKSPKIFSFYWVPPLAPWIKVNTDGSSKGNPGLGSCSGVYRDSSGRFISAPLGICDSFFTEMKAVLLAINFAFPYGWR
ncbi:hypothetical protein Dsin_029296 [Dipteronia sinensis]|uniref:RNase H type-1 domain-containing protein n=1 Tax=Dipteronia sinensis TaxID=43782 RepID=A0AAD9ZS77_9ROSI|nr:hypothetical protein Dsin_029296 [Dipteronia sinensis]